MNFFVIKGSWKDLECVCREVYRLGEKVQGDLMTISWSFGPLWKLRCRKQYYLHTLKIGILMKCDRKMNDVLGKRIHRCTAAKYFPNETIDLLSWPLITISS